MLLAFIAWVVLTFIIASTACFLGKRYGVEFPIGIMACLIIIASVLANKIILIGPFAVPAGIIVASTTFLITDILSEKFGKHYATKSVWVGFFGLITFIIALTIAIKWSFPEFAAQKANYFASALSSTMRLSIASIFAYLISQHHDIWIYHLLKRKFESRHLWLRNNLSTISSQLIDSIVFIFIAFYGQMPIVKMIFSMWLIKIVIAILDTPFIYIVRWLFEQFPDKKSKKQLLQKDIMFEANL